MKRGFNKTEAMYYLGVKSRFFEEKMMPYLEGKVFRAGNALMFDKKDLDSAWEQYKLIACGSGRVESAKGETTCDVQYLEVSTKLKTAPLRLIHNSESKEFEDVVSKLLAKRRNT